MPITTRVLLIDPVPVLGETLAALWSQQGAFQLDHGATTQDLASRLAGEGAPELILLSDAAGAVERACRDIRDTGYRAPVLVLCEDAAPWTDERLEAVGAQGALARPVRYGVLMARVRQQLRLHAHSDEAVVRIGPYQFRPAEKLLQGPDDTLRLTDKEAAILKLLHKAGAKAVAREVLLDEVWGYNSGVTTHTLETHIYRLRQKLQPNATDPTLLVTDAGGYRLVP